MSKKTLAHDTFSVMADKDNILHITEQSHPTVESSVAMTKEVSMLVQKQSIAKAIIDLSAASIPPSDARKNIAHMLKDSKFEKTAIFGTSTPIRVVAGFIMKAAQVNTRFFETKEEAMTWLEEK